MNPREMHVGYHDVSRGVTYTLVRCTWDITMSHGV
jgi:hypothetical protein